MLLILIDLFSAGKGRTKKEAEQQKHQDVGGHTRKITQNIINSEKKEKEQQKKRNDSGSKE